MAATEALRLGARHGIQEAHAAIEISTSAAQYEKLEVSSSLGACPRPSTAQHMGSYTTLV